MIFRILTRQKELEIMSKNSQPAMLHFKITAGKYVENNGFDAFLSVKLDLFADKNTPCGCVYDQFLLNSNDDHALKFKQFARSLHLKDEYKKGTLEIDDILGKEGYLMVTVTRHMSYHKGVMKRYIVDEYCRMNEKDVNHSSMNCEPDEIVAFQKQIYHHSE